MDHVQKKASRPDTLVVALIAATLMALLLYAGRKEYLAMAAHDEAVSAQTEEDAAQIRACEASGGGALYTTRPLRARSGDPADHALVTPGTPLRTADGNVFCQRQN